MLSNVVVTMEAMEKKIWERQSRGEPSTMTEEDHQTMDGIKTQLKSISEKFTMYGERLKR